MTATDGPGVTRTAVSAASSAAVSPLRTPVACAVCATQHGAYPAGKLTEGAAGHCDDCHATWSGKRRCHCRSCCRTFSSTTAFDQHRRRGECVDPAGVGLIDQDGAWGWPGDGRLAQGVWGEGAEGPGDDSHATGADVTPSPRPVRRRKTAGAATGTVQRLDQRRAPLTAVSAPSNTEAAA